MKTSPLRSHAERLRSVRLQKCMIGSHSNFDAGIAEAPGCIATGLSCTLAKARFRNLIVDADGEVACAGWAWRCQCSTGVDIGGAKVGIFRGDGTIVSDSADLPRRLCDICGCTLLLLLLPLLSISPTHREK